MTRTGLSPPACLVVVAMAAWYGGAANTTNGTPLHNPTPHNHTNTNQDMADKAMHFRNSILGVNHKLREEKERKLLGDQEGDGGVRVVSGASLNALYELYALASYIASISDREETSSELKGATELKGSDTTYTNDIKDLNEKKGAGIVSPTDKKRLNQLERSGKEPLNHLYSLYSLINYVRGEVAHISEDTEAQYRKGKQKRTISTQHSENQTKEAGEADSEAGKESKDVRKWSFYVVISVSVLVVVVIILAIALCILRFCRRAVFSFGSRRPIVKGMCSPVK